MTFTSIFQDVQEAVLSKWTNDVHRMDKRMLSLIILAHASDVLENAFAPLNDTDYEVSFYLHLFVLKADEVVRNFFLASHETGALSIGIGI